MAEQAEKSKRDHNLLNLHQKVELLRLFDQGKSKSEIGHILGIPRTTVTSIIKKKEELLQEVRNAMPMNTKVIHKRDSLIAAMEKLLVVWIEDQISHCIPLSTSVIQAKAFSLFCSLKEERGLREEEDTFA